MSPLPTLSSYDLTSLDTYHKRFSKSKFHVDLESALDSLFTSNLYSFRLPVEFNSKSLISQGLLLKEIPNTMVLLSLIRIICNHKKHSNKENREPSEFARLHSLILQNYILTLGNKTHDLLRKLSELKIIEVDHSYCIGVKSKGYKIGARFENSTWQTFDWRKMLEEQVPEILEKSYISRGKEVLYSLWARATTFFSTWHHMNEGVLKDICRKTNQILEGLTFETPDHIEYLIEQCAEEKQEEHERECQFYQKQLEWSLESRIISYRDVISAIEEKRFFVFCHDERSKNHTNRLFTNYTNLKSDFKPYCRLDGEKLVTIDIKCCQPALLSAFYIDGDEKEKEKYMNIILNDDIYEFLARGRITRNQSKLAMFIKMFAPNHLQRGDFCETFQKEFPILSRRLYNEKENLWYKSVARKMQLTESKIMVLGCLKILLLDKGITCLNVHDAIAAKAKDVETVKQVMSDCFFEEMCFRPVLKVS